MFFPKVSVVSFGLLATSQLVAGHSAIIGATGDQGGQGSAIGVDPATPRDGTRRDPFQQDATRFKGDAAATCGETLGAGDNDIQAGTQAVMAQNGATLPQISAGGALMMTVHQVNGDGAGPYTCMIDATGTGTNWTAMQVTTNIDGNARGRNNDQQMMDLPLNAAVAADQTCTGTVAGQSNVCMVRCQNPARAGPFGGCVPVQMAGAAAPAAAAPGAAASGAAAPAAAPAAAAPGAAAPAAAAPAAAPGAAAPGAAAPGAAAPAAAPAAAAPAAAPAAAAPAAAPAAAAPAAPIQPANPAAAVQPANAPIQPANPAAAVQPATTVAKRSPKKNKQTATPKLTNDDQEEEVDLLGDDLTARYVVADN